MRGLSFIAGSFGTTGGATFHGVDPTTGAKLPPVYYEASQEEVSRSCNAAWDAFEVYGHSSNATRARFLCAIADAIASSDEIIVRGQLETGLPQSRMQAERTRTCNQLRMFASVLEAGNWVGARIEHGEPERQPVPKPDVRCMRRPIGPVAVFCASNFSLAFSVAGGDTASALAAGCPVVVKAHHAHPGVAEMVAKAVTEAVRSCDMPRGVFSMLFGAGPIIGQALVKHPRIKAVGFTGSRTGGHALMDIAAARSEPIPVYAEMSSVNPVVLLPDAIRQRGASIAQGLHASVTLGVGQFCTNPGLVFIPAGVVSHEFRTTLVSLFKDTPIFPMLHRAIRESYAAGVARIQNQSHLEALVTNSADTGPGNCHAGAALFQTSIEAFLRYNHLAEEVFGPSTLLITYQNADQLRTLADRLEGQLTATVHGDENELVQAAQLIAALERKVGRVVFNGFPTGVEVCHAMVHGGPYPATSDGRSTSVGTLAIERFTRFVAWQNCPNVLLPAALQESNPLKICRLVDGRFEE